MTSADSDSAGLEELFRAMPIGVALIVAPGRVVWANAAYFETTGRSTQLLGTDFHEIGDVEGTWSGAIRTALDAALRSGVVSTFRSVRALHRPEARGIYLDVDIRPLPTRRNGRARAMLCVRDVSDREEEERKALLFYESFRSSPDPMQLTDAQGVMLDVNPAFERVFGYSRDECVGQKASLVRSEHTPSELFDRMWADLKDPSRGFWSGEIYNRDRQGRERPVRLSISAIRTPAGRVTHYLGVAVDRSEQRRWEMQAAHADRLSSVGQLAAGVAHEINTPLANVMLIAESLRRRSSDEATRARVDSITEQVEAAARIVRGLLDFARRDDPQVAEVDLVVLTRDATEFLRGKLSADVTIAEEVPPGPVRVMGDRGQIIQVLTNLLNNAADAVGGRGTIRVSVRQQERRAEIDVVDDGPGIPPEVMPHLFDPFFTTKPEGQGTGLGLAICHGIVQSHHGTISARNVPGAGAGFLVSFPGLAASPRMPAALLAEPRAEP